MGHPRFGFAILAVMGVSLLEPALARADTAKRFRAVMASCATTGECAASITAVGGGSTFTLSRGPEARARWTVQVSTGTVLIGNRRPVALSIDNSVDILLQPGADYAAFVSPSNYYVISPSALDRLMLQIQRGHDLRFAYIDVAGAPHTDRFPLDGLQAALNEIDSQQKRVGGDRRAAPPEGLPPAASLDEAAVIADAGVPQRLMEWHLALSACEAPDSASLKDAPPKIAALSETVTLYALPCYRSAGGLAYRLYTLERGEIGGMDDLTFASFSPRFGWVGTDTLFNVALTDQTGGLDADQIDEKGCRLAGHWTWDETAFRMDRLAADPDCQGSAPARYKTVFPAP